MGAMTSTRRSHHTGTSGLSTPTDLLPTDRTSTQSLTIPSRPMEATKMTTNLTRSHPDTGLTAMMTTQRSRRTGASGRLTPTVLLPTVLLPMDLLPTDTTSTQSLTIQSHPMEATKRNLTRSHLDTDLPTDTTSTQRIRRTDISDPFLLSINSLNFLFLVNFRDSSKK